MIGHTTHLPATLALQGSGATKRADPVCWDGRDRSGDPAASDGAAAYRRYAATLALLADAIEQDADRHPATRNTTAMIVRALRDAAGDCAGVAGSLEAAAA